jgi:hypothetical protein
VRIEASSRARRTAARTAARTASPVTSPSRSVNKAPDASSSRALVKLSAPWGRTTWGSPWASIPERRAPAPVMDDHRAAREQRRLRHEALDRGVGRQRRKRVGVAVVADRDEEVDVLFGEPAEDRAEHVAAILIGHSNNFETSLSI